MYFEKGCPDISSEKKYVDIFLFYTLYRYNEF